ncbi:hypothetical protein Vadar_032518 [Vaccinium darrowii]|uniref:Uncharacterized protein n=1 Tax=Vaccinium darrowii TaxID=229202 RepID=A0ACB7Z7M4_9ERIC|nr:hypothetical protein Vadar_032518 [Vaccinium darrowii]
MSDRQKGLIEAVRTLNPSAEHRFCVRHLYNNFKQDFKGLVLKDILWKAVRATTVQSFNRAMQEMKQIDANAYNWLSERPPVHWSRSHFSSYTKCHILLNNLFESFNSCILGARDQPIVGMLESIRLILMDTIKKKRTAMMRYNGVVCPKVVKTIEKLIGSEYAKGWVPRWCSNDDFEVAGPNGAQYKVNIPKRYCGCRKWEISGIPCIHAIAALGFNNLEPLDYVDDCYKVETYMKIYENSMGPINGKDMWPSTDNVPLLPPDVKKRAGRPKKARRREPEEPPKDPCRMGRRGIKMTCRKCGKVGHNKRGCKNKGQRVNDGASGDVNAAIGSSGVPAVPPAVQVNVSAEQVQGQVQVNVSTEQN